MKKSVALLLALLCAMGSFVACGETEQESKTPVDETPNTSESQETQPEETAKPTPNWDSVDKVSLSGRNINITGLEYTGENDYIALDFEDYTSDVLDDAVYERNRLIENTLECKINYTTVPSHVDDALKQSVNSGDGSVEISYSTMTTTGSMLPDGYLMPFDVVDTIDVTNVWWDQSLLKDITIMDHVYFGLMDFGLAHYDKMSCLFYNGKILAKYTDMTDPYDLYKNGQWTMDIMLEMIQNAAEDLNGDGVMEEDVDQYGLVGSPTERMPMIHSSGLRIIEWDDEQNTFVLPMGDEKYLSVLEKIVQFNGSVAKEYNCSNTAEKASYNIYSNGRALFYASTIGEFKNLRSVEDDYGIIPYPAYDFESDRRTNIVLGANSLGLAISIPDKTGDGKPDFSEIGIFLEAIGAYTHDVVVDVYIEKSVKGKGLRDEKSVEIFEEMVQNRSTCIVAAFQDYGFNVVYNLQTDVDSNFASGIKGFEKKFNALSKRLVDLVVKQVDKIQESLA